MVKENQNKINVVLQSLMENLSGIVDANAVVGTPIKTEDGDIIIPISKITIGLLSGGGEYGKSKVFNNTSMPCSVGNGTVVSIKPSAFLVKNKGEYKIMQTEKENLEKLIDKAVDLASGIKDSITDV